MPKRFKVNSEPVFKPYYQNNPMLLPPRLDELIPANHLVRVINDFIEKVDISPILATYPGGGTSSFHPLMLLKVIIYAYVNRVYSVRQIAKALRENLYYMWLSGMNQPDFRTINNFRSGRLKDCIDEIFVSILMMLMESGYIDLQHYFVDGSKFLANAGKYSHVWKKNSLRYKEELGKKIAGLLAHIDQVIAEENRKYGDRDLAEMGEEADLKKDQVNRTLEEINDKLQERLSVKEPPNSRPETNNCESQSLPLEELAQNSERLKKKLQEIDEELLKLDRSQIPKVQKVSQRIKNKLLPRLKKYEQQEALAGERNSYSKTDPDATFFRFKNMELLAAYNVMVGTQNQFILNYSIHQNPSDTNCFIPHMERLKNKIKIKPKTTIGDSAFGSEENYNYLAGEAIGNYLKYNHFHRDEKGGSKQAFHWDKFQYDEENDIFICPQGRQLVYVENREKETNNGYIRNLRLYRSRDCSGCKYAQQCKKTPGPRTITFSPQLQRYKAEARANLNSDEGIRLRKQRNVDVESVLGQLKFNKRFRRFTLRGKQKVTMEFALMSIAHNIEKMGRLMIENSTG